MKSDDMKQFLLAMIKEVTDQKKTVVSHWSEESKLQKGELFYQDYAKWIERGT